MWKSGNCVFARERTLKSSFSGSVLPNDSSFFETCYRDLQCSPHIRCIYHISFNLWTHMASIWDSNLTYFALYFSNDFFITRSKSKVKSRQCPWRHPEGEGGTTVGVPPSLSKENNKLTSSTIKLSCREHTKYFQSVSKEDENKVLKQQKIHVWASILTCFWAREPPQGRPRDHAGMEP